MDIATYGDLVYCNDIPESMEELEVEHISEQWRLFTDSSKFSWKAVLLHNGNTYPVIPLAHTVHMK